MVASMTRWSVRVPERLITKTYRGGTVIKSIARLGIASLALMVASVGLSAAPADAATSSRGKVISKTDLSVRLTPTTSAGGTGSLEPGRVVSLKCKVHGRSVAGNTLWYLLPDPDFEPRWVSARYVANIGKPPKWCGGGMTYTGRTTAAASKHAGPSPEDPRTGTLAKGSSVTLSCQVFGPSADGDDLWYWISGTREWVSGRDVANVGTTPAFCEMG